jgi:hypothetical protein
MKIALCVISAHFFLIMALVYFQTPSTKVVARRPVAVKTYVLHPNKPAASKYLKLDRPISLLVMAPAPAESEKEKTIEIETAAPEIRKETAESSQPAASPPTEALKTPNNLASKPNKPIEKKKEEPKKTASKPVATAATKPSSPTPASKSSATSSTKTSSKAAVKKEAATKNNSKQQKLISLMQQSLKTLNGTSNNQAVAPMAPSGKMVEKLASEALTFGANYEEELVSYLEALLTLPEKGKVRLKLTLKREGSVQKIEILNASSGRNKKYVENALAACSFPSFGARFKGESAHTFTITLTNEDSR